MIGLQLVKDIYRSMPPWMTSVLRFTPNCLIFGKSYRECMPDVDVECLGINLKTALDYTRIHTQWGRECVPEKVSVEDAEQIIQTLPLISSDELAASPEKFLSDEATPFNSYWTTTGGSGRNPTSIKLSNSSYGIEWKHMHRIWSNEYSRRTDLKLTFRGYHLREGELVRYNPIYNELSVDPFQLSDENFPRFLNIVRQYNVSCLHGYPSLISLFMSRLESMDEIFPIKLILLASEGASVELKHKLQEFFGAKVISWYGQSEKVVLAYDLHATGQFVNFSSYGYPWILNPDENGIGEIIGTTFVNTAMPLINYRTGDYGRISRTQICNGCDGVLREVLVVDSLHGRWGKDFVFKSRTNKIPVAAINLHSGILQKIWFYQIVQNEYGRIQVRVLPKKGFSSAVVCRDLVYELSERLKGIDVQCVAVKSDSEFVRSSRGKMIMLVQNLKQD